MKEQTPKIGFIYLDILENYRFWKSFVKMHTAEEVVKEVIDQAEALALMDVTNHRFGESIKEAISRTEKKRMAGALGGQKRAINAGQNVKTLPQRQTTKTAYPSKDELYDFAQENNIADGIARQFYEINESRGWRHRNGQPISNWKGALVNFNKRMSSDDSE